MLPAASSKRSKNSRSRGTKTCESRAKTRQSRHEPESAPARVARQHRLDVDDRRPIDCLEAPDADSATLDRQDLDTMQPQRIGPVLGTGVEDSLLGSRRVVPRVDLQDVTA